MHLLSFTKTGFYRTSHEMELLATHLSFLATFLLACYHQCCLLGGGMVVKCAPACANFENMCLSTELNA